ncbi:MAG: dihydropteroate synthase [Rhodospirillales bacterium]|nr:dihydropteroate synthase [Rhodospirillales bacterium]
MTAFPSLLRPIGLIGGAAALRAVEMDLARPLAGGPLAFLAVEAIQGERRRVYLVKDVPEEWRPPLAALTRPRAAFAGLSLDRPLLMGIVNATPDSFSDRGAHAAAEAAILHASTLLEAGADLIDVGGESTRPCAAAVSAEEQIRRIEPVIRALAARGAVVSVDSRDPEVMRAALAFGARIANDVSAFQAPGAIEAVAQAGASAILVHMQGEPRSMQEDPRYQEVTPEVLRFLAGRLAACAAAGLPPERLAVDPGIGFGKRGVHNAALLEDLAAFHVLGVPIVVGASRKGWVGALEAWPPAERLGGSLTAALAALDRGAQILRVHDVTQTHQARLVWGRLNRPP